MFAKPPGEFCYVREDGTVGDDWIHAEILGEDLSDHTFEEEFAMSDGSIHFTALKNFRSKELDCEYYEGLGYTARPMEKHDKLRALLPAWVQQGLVRYGREVGSARIKGTGVVEAPKKKG